MVTQAQIAGKAKVSRALVSHVLNGRTDLSINGETRERILQISRELGYKSPRRREALVSHKILAVGIDVHSVEGFVNPYYAEFLRGATDAAEDKGFHFLLFNPPTFARPRNGQIASAIEERRVEGVLNLGPIPDELLRQCKMSGFPVSIAGSQVDDPNVDCTYVRVEDANKVVAEYLYGMGHRKVAYMDRPKDSPFRHLPTSKQSLEALGLDSSFMLDYPEVCGGEVDREAGQYMAFDFLKKRSLPGWSEVTALDCGNDLVAMGVMDVFMSEGIRIPSEISIVSRGNIRGSEKTFPPLTTVHIPKYEIGKLATQRLISRVENPEELAQQITLPVSMKHRGTVADLNQQSMSQM